MLMGLLGGPRRWKGVWGGRRHHFLGLFSKPLEGLEEEVLLGRKFACAFQGTPITAWSPISWSP